MKEQIKSHEAKCRKRWTCSAKELAAVRAGRANPAVLDKITVEYYGATDPAESGCGNLLTPTRVSLAIQPWTASVLKGHREGDPGLRPRHQPRRTTAKQIRLNFPPLTEERRKELIKGVSKTGEEAKVALRNIRRDALDKFKAAQKKSEITEDELHDGEDKMQKLTDKYVKEVDAMVAKKSKELAEV